MKNKQAPRNPGPFVFADRFAPEAVIGLAMAMADKDQEPLLSALHFPPVEALYMANMTYAQADVNQRFG